MGQRYNYTGALNIAIIITAALMGLFFMQAALVETAFRFPYVDQFKVRHDALVIVVRQCQHVCCAFSIPVQRILRFFDFVGKFLVVCASLPVLNVFLKVRVDQGALSNRCCPHAFCAGVRLAITTRATAPSRSWSLFSSRPSVLFV